MVKLVDTYALIARYIPSVVSAFPLLVLGYFLSGDVEWQNLGHYLASFEFLGGLTLSVIGLYFFAEIIRFAAKLFQARLFADEQGFPTTYFMLYGDATYSDDFKGRYRRFIKRDFDIDLPDRNTEAAKLPEATRLLGEAAKQVILKVGEGKLVLAHNKLYGLVRNLVGGAVFALAFCASDLLIGIVSLRSRHMVVVSFILAIPYLFLLIFWKPLLKQTGEAYAKQLLAEYMAMNSTGAASSQTTAVPT